ncbi:MAG: arginine--tRNA ligase [Paenibacillaceae bacterium]
MIDYKQQIAVAVSNLQEGLTTEELSDMVEVPSNSAMGDYSLPCFKLSKAMRKAPQAIAEDIKLKLQTVNLTFVARTEAVSGYLNIYLDQLFVAGDVLRTVIDAQAAYGSDTIGVGKTIVIDYSSPNIAKPFHVGHLRSTMIGQAIYKIHEFLGFRCVGINHLGDWGTQFGKQIVAYKRWGNEQEVEQGGVRELVRLYVKFHEEAEQHPELEEQARAEFVKLEQGDPEATKLWSWFIEVSYKQFNKIYDLLGVSFDSETGESFYNDKMSEVVQELKDKQLLTEDHGAMIVRLDDYNMPPALIIKTDGATLYHTRDITASIYRKRMYDFDKCIYVVDYAQNLHFAQWFKVVELMGYEWAGNLEHVAFGRVSMEGGGFSTRKGNAIWLEDVLSQAIEKTLAIINEKNPDLPNKEEVARQVGVGAIVFNDLRTNRIKDVIFSWEEILNFEGETGPYVQYTLARACSLFRKTAVKYGEATVDLDKVDLSLLCGPEAQAVLKEIYVFPLRIKMAMEKLEPSLISRYLVDLAQTFNRFYHECPIVIDDEQVRAARLALVRATVITLRNGLKLIGLAAPEEI